MTTAYPGNIIGRLGFSAYENVFRAGNNRTDALISPSRWKLLKLTIAQLVHETVQWDGMPSVADGTARSPADFADEMLREEVSRSALRFQPRTAAMR